MFGVGKGLTNAQKKAAQKKGEKLADSIIKMFTPPKQTRSKEAYKHKSWRPKY